MIRRNVGFRCCLLLYTGFLALSSLAAELSAADAAPRTIVLVDASAVTRDNCTAWKSEGFSAIAVVLDDSARPELHKGVADLAATAGLDLFWWIEVARCPAMADTRPELIAAIGTHPDWRSRHRSVRQTQKGEVVKAWPWVPIGYREAFELQLARVRGLLAKAPPAAGILLNDLQGGPAACGCGNLQCRWAIDYHVPSTATKAKSIDSPAVRFVLEVKKFAAIRQVIPVWTTECEEEDLSSANRKAAWSTGYCGDVPCFETCSKKFREQWAALRQAHDGPVAILALHQEFGRGQRGGPGPWISRTITTATQASPPKVAKAPLWAVVQGYSISRDEESAARQAATAAGVSSLIIARTRINQTYEPRVISAK